MCCCAQLTFLCVHMLRVAHQHRVEVSGEAGAGVRSYKRLFSQEPLPVNRVRMQHLVNMDTGGKPYNIIVGNRVCVQHMEPTIPERRHYRHEHPSMIVAGI